MPFFHMELGTVQNFVVGLFALGVLISLAGGFIGLIAPSIFRFGKAENPSRRKIAGMSFAAFILAFVGFGMTVPEPTSDDRAKAAGEEQAAKTLATQQKETDLKAQTGAESRQEIIDQLSAMTADRLDDSDIVVPDCQQSSRKVSIETLAWADTEKVCRSYFAQFGDHPQVRVLRRISKVASLLSIKQYEPDDPVIVSQAMLTIMKDRKQSDPTAQMRTAELIWKMEAAWEGAVSISDLHDFLKSSGDMAAQLSDDGLLHMAAIIKEEKAR